jgi:hypothetical protein
MVGTKLAHYEITSHLGTGGMGEVYQATDSKLGRSVAIKLLPEAFTHDRDRAARFEREARVLASLNHPNIAAIYGIEESGGRKFLVMELVGGETLAERIQRGAIPVDEALGIAMEIAIGLEAAHEKGIIHRDLKPANVKIAPDGKVKILDFGLAKAYEPELANASLSNSPTISITATQAGMILGTGAYMSPEQARGKTVDKSADIWAFGAVLFEMLTGARAFAADDVSELLASVLAREPDWTRIPPNLSPALAAYLKRCLQKNPKQRIHDIADVRLALEGAFDLPSQPTVPVTAPVATRARQRVAWGLATLATLLAIGVSILYLRAPRQTQTLMRFLVAPPFGAVRPVNAGFGVAPDGQTLAFSARGADGVSRIFVKRPDAAEAQPVPGTDLATSLFWAPDGLSLGFAKEGGLYRVALDGSALRWLCDVPGNTLRGGTWSSGGVIVFASALGGLLQVPDTSGKPTPVTTLDAVAKEERHVYPWFLPDGRHVLFLALAVGQTRGIIWATSIDNPARTRIVESSGAVAYADGWLLSTTDTPRSLIVQQFDPERLTLRGTPQPVRDQLPGPNTAGFRGFAVSSSGVLVVDRPTTKLSQLVWKDRSGKDLSTVGPRATINAFALARDELRVVAQVRDSDSAKEALWLYEKGREDGTPLTYEKSIRPLWAIDGRHIYFTGVNFALRMIAIGATAATDFENTGPFMHFEDVTKGGRYVVFTSLKYPTEIWIQDIGSAERRPLVQGPFFAARPRVSRDSRWLAYTLDLPSGTTQVFAQPFERPGDRIPVSLKGGIGPVWGDNSLELYYEGPEGLMQVQLRERGGKLESGTPQRLFPIHTQGNVVNQPHNFEVAADGQKFLVNTIVGDSDSAPLEVTFNWTTGLKK